MSRKQSIYDCLIKTNFMDNLLSKLTVNILTYKTNNQILKKCISSIDRSIKINIIENSNSLKDQNLFKQINPNLNIILTGKNLGYGGGHNYGLEKTKTQYALILNPDLVCKENYFTNIKKYLNEDLDFSIIGSQYEPNKMNKPAYGLFNKKKYNLDLPASNIFLQTVDWVVGCSMLIDLNKFTGKKLFDENFFLFYEETDLCRRVKNIGKNIFSSKVLIIDHLGEKGSFGIDVNDINYVKLRNWHLMWSSFYFDRKHNNYFFALRNSLGILIRSFFKTIFYLIFFNKIKINKYLYRFLGLTNSILGLKSWYRI